MLILLAIIAAWLLVLAVVAAACCAAARGDRLLAQAGRACAPGIVVLDPAEVTVRDVRSALPTAPAASR